MMMMMMMMMAFKTENEWMDGRQIVNI